MRVMMAVPIPIEIDGDVLIANDLPQGGGTFLIAPASEGGGGSAQVDEIGLYRPTKQLFKSVQDNNTNIDPLGPNGTDWWTPFGSANEWRPFDRKVTQQAEKAPQFGPMNFTFLAPSLITAIGFFRLEAGTVRVRITDGGSPETTIYDQTRRVVDTSAHVSWWDYFFRDVDFLPTMVFAGLPAIAGTKIYVTIENGSGTTKVGQVMPALAHDLGEMCFGSTPNYEDFSTTERDGVGNTILIPRERAEGMEYQIVFPERDTGRIMRLISNNTATELFYFATEDGQVDQIDLASTVFGFHRRPRVPIRSTMTQMSLKVEGLT